MPQSMGQNFAVAGASSSLAQWSAAPQYTFQGMKLNIGTISGTVLYVNTQWNTTNYGLNLIS